MTDSFLVEIGRDRNPAGSRQDVTGCWKQEDSDADEDAAAEEAWDAMEQGGGSATSGKVSLLRSLCCALSLSLASAFSRSLSLARALSLSLARSLSFFLTSQEMTCNARVMTASQNQDAVPGMTLS